MALRRGIAAVLIPALLAPAAALAQQPNGPGRERSNHGTTTAVREKADTADLPVSLDRIRRKLTTGARTPENKNGLKIEYYVEVYGRAPRLELFTQMENLASAPVMYGGMTHQEFVTLVTPQEFRAPAADIGAAVAALIKWAAEKKKEKKK